MTFYTISFDGFVIAVFKDKEHRGWVRYLYLAHNFGARKDISIGVKDGDYSTELFN